MKRLVILFGLLLSFGALNAQTAQTTKPAEPSAQQRAHNQALRMQKNLTLTAEQTTQVEAVFLAKNEAIEKIKADNTKTDEVKKAEIEKVKAEKDTELKTILSPEQYAQYQQIKAQRAERKAKSGGDSGE